MTPIWDVFLCSSTPGNCMKPSLICTLALMGFPIWRRRFSTHFKFNYKNITTKRDAACLPRPCATCWILLGKRLEALCASLHPGTLCFCLSKILINLFCACLAPLMRVLLYVSQRSMDGWYPDSSSKQASSPSASSGKPRTIKRAVRFSTPPRRGALMFTVTQTQTPAPAGYLMWWGKASPQAKSSFSPDLQ